MGEKLCTCFGIPTTHPLYGLAQVVELLDGHLLLGFPPVDLLALPAVVAPAGAGGLPVPPPASFSGGEVSSTTISKDAWSCGGATVVASSVVSTMVIDLPGFLLN